MSAPTTGDLGPQGDRATYRIAHYHGVVPDRSFTVGTKDIGQTSRSDTKETLEDSSLLRLDSMESGADELNAKPKQQRFSTELIPMVRGHVPRPRIQRWHSPALPPRPSALTSQTPRQTCQEQTSQVLGSLNELKTLLSPSNSSQYTQRQAEPTPLSSAHVQTLVPRRSPKHSDISRIDSSPKHQHSSPLIDLVLQNRLWLAVQQNRVSDAREEARSQTRYVVLRHHAASRKHHSAEQQRITVSNSWHCSCITKPIRTSSFLVHCQLSGMLAGLMYRIHAVRWRASRCSFIMELGLMLSRYQCSFE